MNPELRNTTSLENISIYDANYTGIEYKFASSIMHVNQNKGVGVGNLDIDTEILEKWRDQSLFDFGYFPFDEQKMPGSLHISKGKAFLP